MPMGEQRLIQEFQHGPLLQPQRLHNRQHAFDVATAGFTMAAKGILAQGEIIKNYLYGRPGDKVHVHCSDYFLERFASRGLAAVRPARLWFFATALRTS
jgi:hypothetical protein